MVGSATRRSALRRKLRASLVVIAAYDLLQAAAGQEAFASLPTSPCCPPEHVARNIALGYLHTAWARLGCLGPFEEAATGHGLELMQGRCWLTIRRPQGDLAVVMDDELDVVEGLMQLRPGTAWRRINAALCATGRFVGLEEVRGLVLPEAEIDFAFRAIVAERVRMDPAGQGCGPALALQSSPGNIGRVRVQSLQWSSEHVFNISVSEKASPGVRIPVEVRLARKPHWQGDAGPTEYAFSFIRSTPVPCGIFANTTRRLTEEQGEVRSMWEAARGGESNASAGLEGAPARALGQYAGQHADFLQRESMPIEYDLRQDREDCLQPPRGHGLCGSSWVVAALGAFEKQLCRLSSSGAPAARPSRQWALDCAVESSGCDGGALDDVHEALRKHGAVAEERLPYLSGVTHEPRGSPLGPGRCREARLGGSVSARVYARGANAYELSAAGGLPPGGQVADSTQWLSGERSISVAILSYGAVATTMAVYADLAGYRSGVYRRQSADFQGRSAVQLLGWGVEPRAGTPYWIVEHSWGPKWGENQHFRACSVLDCRGEYCPSDNSNPSCFDSATWTDAKGYNCAWYTRNDPGCSIHADTGQRLECPKTCKTCEAPPLPDGEVCGFFRIQRGDDHCGIERLAAHAFASAYSPSVELSQAASAAACVDRGDWNDAFGRGCAWYSEKSCHRLPDIGQVFNCPVACGTCGRGPRVTRPGDGWAEQKLGRTTVGA